jgi:glycosyltransferase involved in cell wall biosynthesis
MGKRQQLLILTRDHIGTRMASPGIRMYNIARVLAEKLRGSDVTLAVPTDSRMPSGSAPFAVIPYERSTLIRAALRSDVLISNYFPPYLYPLMGYKRAILDLFSPFTERLEVAHSKGRDAEAYFSSYGRELDAQLLLADLVLCNSTRQRDLYFGMLNALGRVNPERYDNDRWVSDLLVVAPFGVRDGEPQPTKSVLKGVWPGINKGDTVLIWNGVVIEWYDVTTLIRAMARISQQRSDIKLFFLGTEHPDNPGVPKLQGLGGGTVRSAIRLCEEAGILDTSVFFNFDWVEYEDTANYLLEADAGICTYFENVETRFAFRSRFLDLLWAERPIICTHGDTFAEMVDDRPLGISVPERDVDALAQAIMRLADDSAFVAQCKANLKREKEVYRWDRVLEPVVSYCKEGTTGSSTWRQLPSVASIVVSNQASKLEHAAVLRLARLRRALSPAESQLP